MFDKGSLKNPVNDFIWSLPIEKCGDKDLDWMIKNLSANFQKLYGCTINLLQIQNFYLNNKDQNYLDLMTLCTNSIEYFFLKINTIFEICYQIYVRLCGQNKMMGKSKHDHLEMEFESYRQETGCEIEFDWYAPINAVRNRIAHGGFSIKSFLSEGFLLFQAYDRNLDEKIRDDFGYLVQGGSLVYVDLYSTFFVSKTHRYIWQFLSFVIDRLIGAGSRCQELNIFELQQKKAAGVLCYGYEEIFISTTEQLGKRGRRSAC